MKRQRLVVLVATAVFGACGQESAPTVTPPVPAASASDLISTQEVTLQAPNGAQFKARLVVSNNLMPNANRLLEGAEPILREGPVVRREAFDARFKRTVEQLVSSATLGDNNLVALVFEDEAAIGFRAPVFAAPREKFAKSYFPGYANLQSTGPSVWSVSNNYQCLAGAGAHGYRDTSSSRDGFMWLYRDDVPIWDPITITAGSPNYTFSPDNHGAMSNNYYRVEMEQAASPSGGQISSTGVVDCYNYGP